MQRSILLSLRLFLHKNCRAVLKGATSIVSSSSQSGRLPSVALGTPGEPDPNPKPVQAPRGKKKATAPNPLSRLQRSEESKAAKKKKARKFLK